MNIKSAIFETSAPDLFSCPSETLPEFAFIGRSNVGKSSLLNALTGQKNLARVSDTPGFTKLINFFIVNRTHRLVDLPGYGFAQVGRKDKAQFNQAVNNYLLNRHNLQCVFALIDSRHPPQALDLEFVQWLGHHEVPFVLVFTKTDKTNSAQVQANIDLFLAKLAEWFETAPEVYPCSAITRNGLPNLLKIIFA